MDFNVQYPTIPAGIDPQPVVQVITINIIIATMVKNIFHPVLSSLPEELEVLLGVLEVISRVFEVELELPPILLLLTT